MKIWLFILFSVYLASPSSAKEKTAEYQEDRGWFSHRLQDDQAERRSVFWLPAVSYILPGTAQFYNGQTSAGLVYAGLGAAGAGTAWVAAKKFEDYESSSEILENLDSLDPTVRRYIWGLKTYDLAGSLSAYHSFQTAVETRQKYGEFLFLPRERETTDQLLLAPFEFSNLRRWTTVLPLALGVGAMVWIGANDDFNTRSLKSEDVLFSSALSYNAGVGEEALFRGWLFPVLVQGYGERNIFWANFTQSFLFGAAHLSAENELPLFQMLAGYYFGWLAQKNNWSLRESIFVHTWWDVIVFTASFTQGNRKASIYVPLYQAQF